MKKPGLLAVLFFLSGTSGLIYQVVWFRRLALIFGVTSYALGIVLAAFMAGLAIGSAAGGWWAERSSRPLRAYGGIEIAIAILGLSVLPLIDVVQQLYVSQAPGFREHLGLLSLLRFGLSFVVLIPATFLMGATLPLGVRAIDATSSRGVSRLYAANTAGAVLGVLAGGFVLLGVFGLRTSVVFAAVLNAACGVIALVLARAPDTATAAPPEAVEPMQAMSGVQKAVLAAMAVSGFAALAYEIVWTRLFAVLAFEIVYGYAIMLAVLLAGIALGSALYGRWATDRGAAVSHLLWLELGIACSAAVSLLWLQPLANERLMAGTLQWPGLGDLVRRCAACMSLLPGLLAVVFVNSVLSGATIPAAARVCAGSGRGWATRLGFTYASNVVGGVLGSLVVGFWLLPAYGAHLSILTIAALNVLVAAGLAMATRRRTLGVAILAIGMGSLSPALIERERFDIFRTALSARLAGAQILWFDEGVDSSVAVAETRTGDNVLLINGAIHSGSAALQYHRWLGHLGAIAHPNPREALIIGLGGGGTAGAMALYPDLDIHVVELSNGVLSAADVLSDDNYRLFTRAHVTREADDGRNHLLVSGRTYDIIEADIVEPRHAGAGVLYSHEFFESARRALKPGGIMIQWLGGPGTDAYKWTLNTFRQTFPHVTLWINGDVGIGSNEPQTPIDRARIERFLADPTIRPSLEEVNLGTVDSILALRATKPREIPHGPMITDDHPVLEYFVTLPYVTQLAYGSR